MTTRRPSVHVVESLEGRRLLSAVVGIGGAGYDSADRVVIDPAGSTVTAGQFSGTADFQPGRGRVLLTARGDSDGYVVKHDTDGTVRWAIRFGGDLRDEDFANPDRRDLPTNPLRSGFFPGRQGDQPRRAGQYVHGLALGPGGDVYVAGAFRGTMSVGDGSFARTFTTPDGDYYDAYVLRLDGETGDVKYASVFSGRFDVMAMSLSVDTIGNATVGGYFTRTVDFNPNPRATFELTALGRDDGFVARLSVSGRLAWVSPVGGEGLEGQDRDAVHAVVLSADRTTVYAAGSYAGTLRTGGPNTSVTPGSDVLLTPFGVRNDAFVMSIDNETGELGWVSGYGGPGRNANAAVGVGPDGSVYTAGYMQDVVDVDGSPARQDLRFATPDRPGGPRTHTDVLVQRHTAGGEPVWSAVLGGNGVETIGGMAVDEGGSVYVAGGFWGTMDFSPGRSVVSQTSGRFERNVGDPNVRGGRGFTFDGFLAYLSPNGAYLNHATFGGSRDAFLSDVALGHDHKVSVAGRFGGGRISPFADQITRATGVLTSALGLGTRQQEAALLLAGLERPQI